MHWADYRKGSKKANVHIGFDLNRSIPRKLFLSDGINYWVATSRYGLTVQILAGLITYLLLAIYCREQYNEKVSIQRVRQLRIKIQNELRADMGETFGPDFEKREPAAPYAST